MSRSLTALAGLLLASLLPWGASAASLPGAPAPRPGPDVLYAGASTAPQLENVGTWQADPILVSGATAYRRGEFLYQDHLYDDLGADDAYRYPDDPRYAGNAADLVELRLKPLPGETAFRLTYNTMIDPMAVGTTIGLGDSARALPMPHGANARMPAEVFVTVRGFEADAVDAVTGVTVATGLPVAVDPSRRQVEVRVPVAVFAPGGRRAVRVGAATGPWSGAAYVPQSAAAFFNVAFRQSETGGAWRTAQQASALASGDLSGFAARVDFARLAAKDNDESGVPGSGAQARIFASAYEQRQGRGDAVSRRPGCAAPCVLQYPGRLQPYGLYVPTRPPPATGYPLTIDLHGCGQTYATALGSRRQQQLGERGAGSLVLTPEARGDCYWYYGRAAADVFEAWADVARRYRLDPVRTTIVGTSMGGYGALKLAAAYPDLFARAGAVAPCPGAGIEWTGARSLPGGRARHLRPLLPALRNVPVTGWLATGDATCRYAAQVAMFERLAALGHRFSALTFDGVDHNALAAAALADAQPLADFLGDARVQRDPARVTYVVSPAVSEPEFGLRADHAYWLSGITAARSSTAGRIDVDTGAGDTRPGLPVDGSGVLAGGLAYTSVSRLGDPAGRSARNRLRVTARGVGAATVDAARARTGCRPAVRFETDVPLALALAGCNRTYVGSTVCHPRPVFSVVARAPAGDRAVRRSVTVGRARSTVGRGRVRIDLSATPGAVARVRVASVDRRGRTWVRVTAHRVCPPA